MKHRLLFLGVTVFALHTAVIANDCDAVLVEQIESVSEQDRRLNSWLQIIDDAKFQLIKKSGKITSDYFNGSFKDFQERRSRRFQQSQYFSTTDTAREEFKSYLKDQQIDAWLKCMNRGTPQLTVHYENVDLEGATIKLTWVPNVAGLEAMTLKPKPLEGVKSNDQWSKLTTLKGSDGVRVFRESSSRAISGSISGVAGVGGNYFASVYVPPFVAPQQPATPPRYLLPAKSLLLRSTARWDSEQRSITYNCTSDYPGFDLIVLEEKSIRIGKHLGFCAARNKSHCDSDGEACFETFVARGCWVNSEWHNWYKSYLSSANLPYAVEAVCNPVSK